MGQKQACVQHNELNRFFCNQCQIFICQKCLDIHQEHEIKNIENVCFDTSDKLSNIVTRIDNDIQNTISFTKFTDLKPYFSSCYTCLNLMKSKIEEIGNQLRKLDSLVTSYIQNSIQSTKNLINKETFKKQEFLNLNKEISDIINTKDLILMSKLIIKNNDLITKEEPMNVSFLKTQYKRSNEKLENLKEVLQTVIDNWMTTSKTVAFSFNSQINKYFNDFQMKPFSIEKSPIGKKGINYSPEKKAYFNQSFRNSPNHSQYIIRNSTIDTSPKKNIRSLAKSPLLVRKNYFN